MDANPGQWFQTTSHWFASGNIQCLSLTPCVQSQGKLFPVFLPTTRVMGSPPPPPDGFPRPPRGLTWWEALNDGLVIHLEGGVATATCKANHVVLAVVHGNSRLIYGDVICAHIEDHADLPLFLCKNGQFIHRWTLRLSHDGWLFDKWGWLVYLDCRNIWSCVLFVQIHFFTITNLFNPFINNGMNGYITGVFFFHWHCSGNNKIK